MKQSATERAIDLLELLVEFPDGIALGDICSRLTIPKSIAHRLLALLIKRGFVRQEAATGRYGLTLKLSLLGARHLASTGLSDVSQPILDKLAAASGELARLAVVEGEGLVWVAKAQGARHGLRYDPDAGTQVVLHATSAGKAWLATLPEAEALRIIEATGFSTPAHFGPRVILDVDTFRQELAVTRERSFGLAIEEGEPGTAAMAVVVRASSTPTAQAVGTLSLAGPVSRFTPQRREVFLDQLRAAAEDLSGLWPMRGSQAIASQPIPQAGPSSSRGDARHAV